MTGFAYGSLIAQDADAWPQLIRILGFLEYGAFFLSKFNLLVVFTNSILLLFNIDIRILNSIPLLFNHDIRFSTSTFVLFNLDISFFFKPDVRILRSIYMFLLKRDICFQFVVRFSLNIFRFKKNKWQNRHAWIKRMSS